MSNISELIQHGETETTEFKESWRDEWLKTLAAFANTRGGTLLVGIKDNKQLIGWQGDSDQITSKIVNHLRIAPKFLSVEQVKRLKDGKPFSPKKTVFRINCCFQSR